MIIDRNLTVSGALAGTALVPSLTGQTVTGASAVLSTDTVDLSQARDIGQGNDLLKAHLQVVAAFTGLTALTAEVIVADDAALTTNVTVVGSSGSIPVAELIIGARFAIELNPRLNAAARLGRRYLGIRYTPTGTGTAGSVFASFGMDYQDGNKAYPSGFAVL